MLFYLPSFHQPTRPPGPSSRLQSRVGPVLVLLRRRVGLLVGIVAPAGGFARRVDADGASGVGLDLAEEEPGALLVRPLVGRPRDAVPVHVELPFVDQVPAAGPEPGEVVSREREVHQAPSRRRELAERVRHHAVEQVVGQVELLHAPQARVGRRDGAREHVRPGVDHRGLAQQAQLVGDAAAEPVVEEQHLQERVPGARDGRRDRPRELVVGEREVVDRRVPEVVRERARELVVVDEDGLDHRERGEEPRGELAVEAVEPDVDERRVRDRQHLQRERGWRELVVAEVQLVEVLQRLEVGHGAAEVVGVGVEQGQVREPVHEALHGVGLQAVAVEVDGRDGAVGDLVRPVAVEALVGAGAADVGAGPAAGDVLRVADHRLLELLDHQVRPVETLVLEVATPRLPWLRLRRGWHRLRPAAAADPDADPAAAVADADAEVLPVWSAGIGGARRGRNAGDQEAEESDAPSTCHFLIAGGVGGT